MSLMDPDLTYEERLSRLEKIVEKSNKIVFFGGAGVSTGSGIPDFRSKDGLYNKVDEEFAKYKPEYLLSKECFNHNPKVFYQFYKKKMDARNYEPNIVHKKLAQLESEGKMLGIVTQNIDMLHEKAGSKNIFKIHGTIGENYCIKCHKQYDINYIFDSTEAIPKCECGKSNCYVRPNVTLYGENLPKDAVNGALEILEQADCLIVAGTSLQVEPAASMISYFQGEYMIILNREPTSYDNYADLIFREDMNEVFSKLK